MRAHDVVGREDVLDGIEVHTEADPPDEETALYLPRAHFHRSFSLLSIRPRRSLSSLR